ncbi:MAG: hypothetical protein IKZ04_04220 [Spirochaetaceae bacterium]|nr:hypothetical protein [Spirochaetaceae bacterium]
MEYIYSNKPVDDFTDRINTHVFRIKQQEFNKREYESMDIHDQDTFRRGELQAKIQTAKNLISYGDSIDKIMLVTGLSKETVNQLAKEIHSETSSN